MTKLSHHLFTIVLLSFASAFATADVKIVVNDTQYIFQQSPRLSDVLAPIALKQPWYWPASKLYKIKGFSSEKMRSDTIFALSNIAKSKDVELAPMLTQIESWQLAHRVKIPINFEHARFSLDKNPLFENGDYRIILSQRATHLHFFGALVQEQRLAYQENTCLSDYLPQLKTLKAAEKSFVYILPNYATSQDMLAVKAPIAYWNEQCVVPMPGASIYVPLQENQFFKGSTRINQQVISLAQDRVVAF